MANPRGPSSRIELHMVQSHDVASVRQKSTQDQVTARLGQSFQQVREALEKQGVAADGSLFARWHSWGDVVDMEAGFIVPAPITPDGDVKPSQLPGGPVALAVHAGPYEGLSTTYDAVRAWIERAGRQADGGPWEIYLTDPGAEPDPAKWLTEVIFPLRHEEGTAAS